MRKCSDNWSENWSDFLKISPTGMSGNDHHTFNFKEKCLKLTATSLQTYLILCVLAKSPKFQERSESLNYLIK